MVDEDVREHLRLAMAQAVDIQPEEISVGKHTSVATFRSVEDAVVLSDFLRKNPNGLVAEKKVTCRFSVARRQVSLPAEVLPATSSIDIPGALRSAGLHMVEEFLSIEDEQLLMKIINGQEWENCARADATEPSSSHHRRVQHYGATFCYDTRGVGKSATPFPRLFTDIARRINERFNVPHHFDQCTVNEYRPGIGIASHVDTHDQFEEHICSVSLSGGIAMSFRCGNEKYDIYLPRRCLLVMSAKSRYCYTHGIASRKTDCILLPSGETVMRRRRTRYSLSFRTIRNAVSCECGFGSAFCHPSGTANNV